MEIFLCQCPAFLACFFQRFASTFLDDLFWEVIGQ